MGWSTPWPGAVLDRRLFGAQQFAGVDYLQPKGDPGLFGPDSMAWRVHDNPVSLAVGGIAAVILELAEPRVRTGVWEHSSFRADPLSRMRRTGEATMVTTYGPAAAARARIAAVTRMHGRVSGDTPEGAAYRATDPDLLAWVHVTAVFGFLAAYVRFVDPGVGPADQDRYYAESVPIGRAFGAEALPRTVAEASAFLERWRPRLAPHPIITEFLGIVCAASPFGVAGRVAQPLLVEAALSILPPWAEGELNLPVRRFRRAAALPAVGAMAALADKAPSAILRQAYERVGRPFPRG